MPIEELPPAGDKTPDSSKVLDSGACICQYKCVILNPACPVCAQDFSLCKGSTHLPRANKIHTKALAFGATKVVDTEHAYDPCWEHTPGDGEGQATLRLLGLTSVLTGTTTDHSISLHQPTNLILQDGTTNTLTQESALIDGFTSTGGLYTDQSLSINGNGKLNISITAVGMYQNHVLKMFGLQFEDRLVVGETGMPQINIKMVDQTDNVQPLGSNISVLGILGRNIDWKNGTLSVIPTSIRNGANTYGIKAHDGNDASLIFENGELYFTGAGRACTNFANIDLSSSGKHGAFASQNAETSKNQLITDDHRAFFDEAQRTLVDKTNNQVAKTVYVHSSSGITVGEQIDKMAYGTGQETSFNINSDDFDLESASFNLKWLNPPQQRSALPQPNGLETRFDLNANQSTLYIAPGTYNFQVIANIDGKSIYSNMQSAVVDKTVYPNNLIPHEISILSNQNNQQTGTVSGSQFFEQNIPKDIEIVLATRNDAESNENIIDTNGISVQNGSLAYTSKTSLSSNENSPKDVFDIKLESRNYTFDTTTAKLTFSLLPVSVNPLILEGITVADKTYDGKPIVPSGTLKTKKIDGTPIVLDSTTTYQYVAKGNTGASLPNATSATPPTNAGNYALVIDVDGNKQGGSSNTRYAGRTEIDFTINKAPLTVKADDLRAFRLDPLPDPKLIFTGWVNNEGPSVLKAIYRAVHTAENTGEVGSYDINVEVIGIETNTNYAVTIEKGSLIVLDTNRNQLSATPPTELIDIPFVQAIPSNLLPGMGTRYLFSQIANTSTGGAKMIGKLPSTDLENSMFTVYDIDLQKGSITDYIWESLDFSSDLEGSKMTLHLPFPANTNSMTYTYQIYHFPSGENGNATLLPTTVGNYSVYADATAAHSFVLVATPKVDSNYLSETPPDKLLTHPMVQGKSALAGSSIRYVYSNIANTSTIGAKMLGQLPDSEGRLFALYDLKLEKGTIGGTIWNPVNMATDLEGGSAIAHFPIPTDTNSVTYDYEIYHYPNGADQPPVKLTTATTGDYSLYATTTAFSPFAIVSTHKDENPEFISQTPPRAPVSAPMVEGISNLPLGTSIRYLQTKIENTTTTAQQTISQLNNMHVSGSFYIYDIELQKGTITGNDWETVNVGTDLVGGKAIVHLPIPSGTKAATHNYTIYHFANGASKSPNALETKVTANSVYAPTTSFSPFVLVATAKGGGGGGGSGGGSGGSSSTDEYSFWQNVKKQVERAKDGDVIKVNAKTYNRMPWNVMESLYKQKTVGMVITWNGGKPITIPAGTAQKRVANRVYWPLSALAKLYENIDVESVLKPDANEEAGDRSSEKVIPVTGGSLITVDAPETEMIYSNLPQSEMPIQEIAPELSGFERDTFPGVPSPDLTDETSEAMAEPAQRSSNRLLIIGIMSIMLVAATAAITLLVKNHKHQKTFDQDL